MAKSFKELRETLGKPNLAQKIDRAGEVAKQAFHHSLERPKMLGRVAVAVAKPIVKTAVGASNIGGTTAKTTATGLAHGVADINRNIKQQAHSAAQRQSKVPVEKA